MTKERDHYKDIEVDGKIKLNWILEKKGSYKRGNESSDSIKCWDILEWLRDWRLLNKD
jgi:hypothetical protein